MKMSASDIYIWLIRWPIPFNWSKNANVAVYWYVSNKKRWYVSRLMRHVSFENKLRLRMSQRQWIKHTFTRNEVQIDVYAVAFN